MRYKVYHDSFRVVWKRLPLLLFILVALYSCVTVYYSSDSFVHSDIASELLLGKLLAGQNKIVSTDWCYSTGIKFIDVNLIYMSLFKFLDNWRTIHILAALIQQAIMTASYYYFCRKVKLSQNAFYLTASLLLLPVNLLYGRLVLYESYYVSCIIFSFVILGLFFSVIEHRLGNRLWQGLRISLLLLVVFASGLNGFRQLPSTMLPLLVTILVIILKKRRTGRWFAQPYGTAFGLAIAICVVGFTGTYVNTAVLSQHFSFSELMGKNVEFESVDELRKNIIAYLRLFGFEEGRPLLTVEGILSIAGVISAVVMLCISLYELLKKQTETDFFREVTITLYPIAMLLMTFIYLFAFGPSQQYYFTVFVLIFPFSGMLLDHISFKSITSKQILTLAACSILFFLGLFNNLHYLRIVEQEPIDSQEAIGFYDKERLTGALSYIEENGCEIGYATYWNANVITQLTNGRIPMIPVIRVYPYPVYLYQDWLTDKRIRELSFVEDKNVFFLLNNDEVDTFSNSDLAMYGIPTYNDEYFTIYEFDFSDAVWEYLAEQGATLNQESISW